MSRKTSQPSGYPESWHPEFTKAQKELVQIIFSQGPKAIFAPQHAKLVRLAAQHAPPEHAKNLAEMLRTVDFVEASEAAKRVIEAYGHEALTWPEHTHLVEQMMESAHPDLVEAFRHEMQAIGLCSPIDVERNLSLLH